MTRRHGMGQNSPALSGDEHSCARRSVVEMYGFGPSWAQILEELAFDRAFHEA